MVAKALCIPFSSQKVELSEMMGPHLRMFSGQLPMKTFPGKEISSKAQETCLSGAACSANHSY